MPRDRDRRPALGLGIDEMVDELGGHPAASTFVRGLTVGALVGAAIAGSLLLGRRRPAKGRDIERTTPTGERDPSD
jgi:hypothetical protein